MSRSDIILYNIPKPKPTRKCLLTKVPLLYSLYYPRITISNPKLGVYIINIYM